MRACLIPLFVCLLLQFSLGQNKGCDAGTLLFNINDSDTLILLAAHRVTEKDSLGRKVDVGKSRHYQRGWAGFGGTCISDSISTTAIIETYQETRSLYSEKYLRKKFKNKNSRIATISTSEFTTYFLEVDYISSDSIENYILPEDLEDKHRFEERGPYVWVKYRDVMDLILNTKENRVPIDSLPGIPADHMAKWMWSEFTTTLRAFDSLSNAPDVPVETDSLKPETIREVTKFSRIEKDQFELLNRKIFSSIVSPNNATNLGSFASIDTKANKSELAFAASIIPKKPLKRPKAFIINMKGFKDDDGNLPLFSSGSFASGVAIDFQHNWLVNRTYNKPDSIKGQSKERLRYDFQKLSEQKAKIRALEASTSIKLIEIKSYSDTLKKFGAIQKLKEKKRGNLLKVEELKNELEDLDMLSKKTRLLLDSLTKCIDSLKALTPTGEARVINDSTIEVKEREKLKLQKKADSIHFKNIEHNISIQSIPTENTILDEKIKACQDSIARRLDSGDFSNALIQQQLVAKKNRAINDIKEQLPIKAFRLAWASASIGVKGNSFKLYDRQADLDQQIKNETAFSLTAGVAYSIFNNGISPRAPRKRALNKKKFKPNYSKYFFSVYANMAYGDNSSTLTRTTINERTALPSPNGSVRTTDSQTKVLEGDHETDVITTNIGIDYYKFIFNTKRGAIHLYFEEKIILDSDNSFKSGIGLFYSFNSREKQKSFVNAEIFYEVADTFNEISDENKLLKRSSFGLRAAFPISFN